MRIVDAAWPHRRQFIHVYVGRDVGRGNGCFMFLVSSPSCFRCSNQ